MSNNDTLFVMTADQMKAIIKNTLQNAGKGKNNIQTNLTDAVKKLGVDGNWGTALSKGTVVAPGVEMPSAPLPGEQPAPTTYVNCYDNGGNISLDAYSSQEEADEAALNWLKAFKRDYPEVNYDQDYNIVAGEMDEASDYAVRVHQQNFDLKNASEQSSDIPTGLIGQSDVAGDAEALEQRIKNEAKLIRDGDVDYLTCTFVAQKWVGDQTMEVDVDGPVEWNMTVSEALQLTGKSKIDEINEDSYDTDALSHSLHAPKLAKDWDGPFEVEMVFCGARNGHEEQNSEDRVREAANDAFIHVMETEVEIIDLMDELDMGPDAMGSFRKEIVDLWMKKHAEPFIQRVDFEGTQIIHHNVYDETWAMMQTALQEMVDAKNYDKPGL